jgi:5-methylthioadenosine/S-adenosylhomocysteine deaminase
MMLASGVAPVPALLSAGVRLGLGTDGPAGSNNDLDMMEEMDLAAKLQKITHMDPQALGAKQAVEMATIGGARALHMENEIGSLEAGKKADLIVISLNEANAVPLYDVYSQIVYALKASDVQDTIIGGRIVMQNGKVLTLDEPAILLKAREFGAQVKQSLTAPQK